jgi:acyl phosphate:glycerol-3-phosphate acyltransferase
MRALLLTVGFSYLLGSIPFGYILMFVFHGQDVRKTGSGNIGATNVARSSAMLGALTLVLDALKGLAAVSITRAVFPGQGVLPGVAALCAIAGHIFPVWLKFRGGKGVATGLGSFIILAPKAVVVMIAIFAAIVLTFRYVSLGSIVAVALLPLLAWLLDHYGNMPLMLACMAAASILIIAKHHENIRRLLSGTETRFQWGRG